MATMLCLLATTTVFGFSEGIYWAGTSRFLQGCCMGHLIILKSILADVCDDSNLSWGLGVISNSYSTGFIVGPSVTGFLVFPAVQYPDMFASDGVFGRFAILLPIAVTVAGLFMGLIFSVVFLPDDAKKRSGSKSKNTVKVSSFVEEKHYFDYIDLNIISAKSYQSESESATTEATNSIRHNSGISKDSKGSEGTRLLLRPRRITLFSKIASSKIFSVLKVKEFRYSCFLYGSFSALDIGFLELFPTLAATSLEYNGLNFTTSQIGAVMMTASFFLVPVEFLLLPKLNDRFGSKKVLIGTTLFLSIICPLLPVLAAIRSTTLLWSCAVLLIFLFRTCMYTGYLSINMLLNNSVQPSLLGCANGLGKSNVFSSYFLA